MGTREPINMLNNTDSSSIVTIHNIHYITNMHFVELINRVVFQVILDSVIDLDIWIGKSNSPSIMSDQITDFIGPDGFLLNFTQLERSLFFI